MNGNINHKLVALDSNIFIYNLEENPGFVKFTDIIFQNLSANKLKATTSILSLTEILSYPKTETVVKEITSDFFSTPNLLVLEVNREVALEAARIRRKYAYRLPDSIQLATALVTKATAFITNDSRLKRFKELKIILIKDLTIES